MNIPERGRKIGQEKSATMLENKGIEFGQSRSSLENQESKAAAPREAMTTKSNDPPFVHHH
jgi:hypothetical protein